MNKLKLVEKIAAEAKVSKAVAARMLNVFTSVVTKTLAKGDSVRLIGFGTFDVCHRKARTGRNPQTGEKISIKATKAPRFRAGKKFKETVNKR